MSATSYADAVQKTTSQETQAQTDGLLTGSAKSDQNESKKDSLTRISSIPVVKETVDRVLSVIQSHSFLAALYARGEQMANVLFNHTRGLVMPVLQTADVYASKGLDAFEARYPAAFNANTEDVLKTAHMPVDYAVDSFRTRLEVAQKSLISVQDRLSGAVSSVAERVPRNQEDAGKAAQDYYAELIKLREQTKASIAGAPEHVKEVYQPLLSSLQNGIDDVGKMLTDKEVPVTERATKIANYSKDNLPAVVSDTLTNLKSLVISKKEDVQKKASE